MKKFFQKIHKLFGLLAGFFIFISCLTGAIMVFQTEVRELVYAERYFRPDANGREVLPIDTLVARVNATLPKGKVTGVEVFSDSSRNYVMSLEGKDRAEAFVDPYTGKVVAKTSRKDPDFFTYTMLMHRWLMDSSRSWGKQIMGASTLIFVFILISGIVYWWPKTIKQLKASLQVKTDGNRYRLFRDLHVSLGAYASILLLLMALTGLTWSYPWYRSGLYSILGIEMPKGDHHGPGKPHGHGGKERGEKEEQVSFAWSTAYTNVKAVSGEHKSIRIEPGKADVKPLGGIGNERRSDSYKLDKETAKVVGFTAYEDKPAHERIRGLIYSLHVGSWGGIIVKILYFVACILGASFPITGLYIYLKKRGMQRKKQSK